jgi:antitoxin (DNA-binding transcriptional repressor) of toxin-antitoxin stability system
MKYQTMSIGQTRANLAEIIEQVSVGGETFAITKFGKLRALITPVDKSLVEDQTARKKKFISFLDKSSGVFKDRKDLKDAGGWVSSQRKPRYEKIFS